jgi:prepilin-type N-terminal cleavage/methylation domain-containing protein
MLRNTKGFTLIELMIVVVIIGILAAIAIPNFISMQDRAKEGSVKANMHTVQLAIEDFAVQNDGTYPVGGDDAAVQANLPGGVYPNNPFNTAVAMLMDWGALPAASGNVGSAPAATVSGYNLRGYGKSAVLSLQLSNGS